MKEPHLQISEELLIKNGWTKRPAPAFMGDSYLLDIGRNRWFVFSNINNCNQMLMICEYDTHRVTKETIVIHNFDYDGWLSIERFFLIIHALTGQELTIKP